MNQILQFSDLMYEIGKWAGVIGFSLLSFLIFSGDTARYWDKYLGLDRIIKFQRKFSYFVATFVILHPLFFIISKKTVLDFIIPNFSYLPLALGIISFYVFIAVMISSSIYKRISYSKWQYIHVITYLLYFAALYHAINWGSDADDLMPLYIVITIFVIIGTIYRTIYKIKKLNSGKFTISEVKMETHDSFTISIKSEKPFNFAAGQFCFLRLNKNSLHARHPFTISSAPGEEILKFTIKQAGRFTETAKNLTAGEEILIDGPFGKFIPKTEKNLVFIAGGVGITPFMSIIKDHINKNSNQKIILIYGSRTEQDIIFKNEIDSVNKEWFNKVYVLSNENQDSAQYERGYLTKEIMTKYVKDISSSLYYICGPEIMKTGAKKILAELGVENKNVFVENFFW